MRRKDVPKVFVLLLSLKLFLLLCMAVGQMGDITFVNAYHFVPNEEDKWFVDYST